MGRPPDGRREPSESRPIRVARTVRDMFTRGPRGQSAASDAAPDPDRPASAPSWLNSPPRRQGAAPKPPRYGPTSDAPIAPGKSGPLGSRSARDVARDRAQDPAPAPRSGQWKPDSGRDDMDVFEPQSSARRRGPIFGPGDQEPGRDETWTRSGDHPRKRSERDVMSAQPTDLLDEPATRSAEPEPPARGPATPRWRAPEWLPPTPSLGSSDLGEPAPPTTPRKPSDRHNRDDEGAPERQRYDEARGYGDRAPAYMPPETSKMRAEEAENLNFSATAARAALWRSRTPNYESGGPAPFLADPDEYGHDNYVSPYDISPAPASLAHASASSAYTQAGSYQPGAISEVEQLRQAAGATGTSGPAPYFWEIAQQQRPVALIATIARYAVTLLVLVAALASAGYAGLSAYTASKLAYAPQVAATSNPGSLKLAYKNVSFVSRTDHILLQGWFIPGVDANGALTDKRTIIVVHGLGSNRSDPAAGLLTLSGDLAKHGFAVLAFDMRGMGTSAASPQSMGYNEQNDVLGAVDFLRTGPMPYPKLGRPKVIGGWGESMGAVALLFAAAKEPAIRAVVSDSAYADALPIEERTIEQQSKLPPWFTPGILTANRALYGINFFDVRPVDAVASIAPRPIFLIQGANDTYIPSSSLTDLAQAAKQGDGARVQTWTVPKAGNDQAFKVEGQTYVDRVVAFFTANLSAA